MAANGFSWFQRAPYGDVASAWRSILAVLILAIVAGRCGTSRAADENRRAIGIPAAQQHRTTRAAERPFSVRRGNGNVARASFDAQAAAGTEAAQPAPRPQASPTARRAGASEHPATASPQPLVLPARGRSEGVTDATQAGAAPSLLTALGGLLLVLALFVLVVWLLRRGMPHASSPLPPGVVRVLGRAPLAERQYVHLIRVGDKLLLVAVSPAGVETLTEIVDPVEIDRLTGLCGETSAGSVTNAFRQVIDQFSQQRPAQGFVDQMDAAAGTDEPRLPRSQGPVHA